MLVELRSSDRLRGPKALDVSPVLASVLDAARDGTADLSRLRVVCDWIQYKRNFREPIARRPGLPFALAGGRRLKPVHAHLRGAHRAAADPPLGVRHGPGQPERHRSD